MIHSRHKKLLRNVMSPLIIIIIHMFFKHSKKSMYCLRLPTPGDFHFSRADRIVFYSFPMLGSTPASLSVQVTAQLPNLCVTAQPSLLACTELWYMGKSWDSAARWARLAHSQGKLLTLHLWRLHEQLGHLRNGAGWCLGKSGFLESFPSLCSMIL